MTDKETKQKLEKLIKMAEDIANGNLSRKDEALQYIEDLGLKQQYEDLDIKNFEMSSLLGDLDRSARTSWLSNAKQLLKFIDENHQIPKKDSDSKKEQRLAKWYRKTLISREIQNFELWEEITEKIRIINSQADASSSQADASSSQADASSSQAEK
jgi:hypothetical protein